jgi:hypothetical protein
MRPVRRPTIRSARRSTRRTVGDALGRFGRVRLGRTAGLARGAGAGVDVHDDRSRVARVPADTRPRLPTTKPVPSFSTTNAPAANTDITAVRRCPLAWSSSATRSSGQASCSVPEAIANNVGPRAGEAPLCDRRLGGAAVRSGPTSWTPAASKRARSESSRVSRASETRA